MKTILSQALLDNGYTIAPDIQAHLLRYLELLSQWNNVFNLTAIRDPKEMVMLHILDSLSVAPYLHGSRLLDVGTGAGLPGIPLALLHPEKQFVLLDSNSKKTRFLTQVLATLPIKNVEVVHARCEEFKPDVCFDSIISRAFASIQVMLDTTQHLVCADGQFLAMKGVYPTEEIAAIPIGYQLIAVHPLNVKGINAARHLVCIAKNKE